MSQRVLFENMPAEGYRAVLGLDKYVKSAVDQTVLELVKLRASILNGCAYCVDMHSRDALAAGEQSRRLFAVAAWREAPFFDERERAALALTDAVTQLGEHGVSDEVWDTAVKHWSEDGVVNLVLAIGTINLWNRIGVSIRAQPPAE